MMFYKIVLDNMIIDAIHNPVWVVWLSRTGRFVDTDPGTANGIVSRDGSTVYNITGKGLFTNYADQFKTVSVFEISEDEYTNIMSQITGEVDTDIEDHEPTEIEILQKKVEDLEIHARDISIKSNGLEQRVEKVDELQEALEMILAGVSE